MNMFFSQRGEAKLHYGASDFTILEGGAYVFCAVTKAKIPLEELRYWNDDRQEAYRDAAAALEGFKRAGAV
ncbi:MAG: DUF2093 domain-containing protein [Pseudomonadota bacterium]